MQRRFKRKILCRIYGPGKENHDYWGIRNNQEVDELLKYEDIVKFIKAE